MNAPLYQQGDLVFVTSVHSGGRVGIVQHAKYLANYPSWLYWVRDSQGDEFTVNEEYLRFFDRMVSVEYMGMTPVAAWEDDGQYHPDTPGAVVVTQNEVHLYSDTNPIDHDFPSRVPNLSIMLGDLVEALVSAHPDVIREALARKDEDED